MPIHLGAGKQADKRPPDSRHWQIMSSRETTEVTFASAVFQTVIRWAGLPGCGSSASWRHHGLARIKAR